MDFDRLETLRERHASWRLLRAGNATLILAFLGEYFVEGNRGASPASEVTVALDDLLYAINGSADEPRYPKPAHAYLDDWSTGDQGYLRRFYPPDSDDVHYEVTAAFEKSYAWVMALQERSFVGTESRLHTVVELLRQIVHGTDVNPQARLGELQRRRAELDTEIAEVEAGQLSILDATGVLDRYQQLAATARGLLSDFREVEENFRALDRTSRERIALWEGAKGDLLADLVGSRSQIAGSDQGRSFQAFYDYLLSDARQVELTDLLGRLDALADLDVDPRIRRIHHDWSEAAERAQRTVRQISEQLRRFLDDQVWLENRRVADLVRVIEATALSVRDRPPVFGLEVDSLGVSITLPFERPLYQRPAEVSVDSVITEADEDSDTQVLFAQAFVDQARLARHIRSLVPAHSAALLSDVIEMYPVEQGAAEIVGYLALADDDVTVELDESDVMVIEYDDIDDPEQVRSARLAKATVRRR